jgi:hypothetical protein
VKIFAKIIQIFATANFIKLPKMVTLFQSMLKSLAFFVRNFGGSSTLVIFHENCCEDLRENFRHFRMFLQAIIFTFSQKFKT